MINKISSHLDAYLRLLGEQPLTSAHLGPSSDSKTVEAEPPSSEEVKAASKQLLVSMEAEKKSRQMLLYVLLSVSIAWFALCGWAIIFLISNESSIAETTSVFGIDLLGLGLLLPFLHCIYQGKTSIDVFLAVFPNMGTKERTAMTRSLFLYLRKNRCDFGRTSHNQKV